MTQTVKNIDPKVWSAISLIATIVLATLLGTGVITPQQLTASEQMIQQISRNLNLTYTQVLKGLSVEVGSTLYGLQKPCSYIISHPLGDLSITAMQNGTTGVFDSWGSFDAVMTKAVTSNTKIIFTSANFATNDLTFNGISNVTFSGMGKFSSVIVQNNGVNGNVLTVANCSGWAFDNLQINGNMANNPTLIRYGLDLINATNVTFDSGYVTQVKGWGIRADTDTTITITKSLFTDNANDHLAILCKNGATISDNDFSGTTTYNYLSVNNGTSTATDYPSNVVITGNRFTNKTSGNAAIGIEGYTKGYSITGNTFLNCWIGIDIYDDHAENGQITGNNINYQSLAGGRYGIEMERTNFTTVQEISSTDIPMRRMVMVSTMGEALLAKELLAISFLKT